MRMQVAARGPTKVRRSAKLEASGGHNRWTGGRCISSSPTAIRRSYRVTDGRTSPFDAGTLSTVAMAIDRGPAQGAGSCVPDDDFGPRVGVVGRGAGTHGLRDRAKSEDVRRYDTQVASAIDAIPSY